MRYILLIITTVFLLFSSCVKRNKKINQAEQEIINRQDSIDKIRNDSLAQNAWGEAKFGMSIEDVKNTVTFSEAKILKYNEKSDPFSRLLTIIYKSSNEGILSINASFFNNRLYRVDIESQYKTANYFDTQIQETALRLRRLVVEKYGEPSRDYGFPNLIKMNPDKEIMAYAWEIGYKTIYIGVDEKYSSSEYRTTCVILHSKEAEPVDEYFALKNKTVKKENNF